MTTKDDYMQYKAKEKAALSSTATQPATTAAAGQATAQPAPLTDDKAGEKPATAAAKNGSMEQVGTTNSTPINLEPEFKKAEEKICLSETEKERAYQCGACGGSTKSRDRCDSCGVAFQ